MEFVDRYSALGIPRHPASIVCQGQCEGTGWVPVYNADADARERTGRAVVASTCEDAELLRLWDAAEAVDPTDNGWHFVVCPECSGTGIAGAPEPRRGRA